MGGGAGIGLRTSGGVSKIDMLPFPVGCATIPPQLTNNRLYDYYSKNLIKSQYAYVNKNSP